MKKSIMLEIQVDDNNQLVCDKGCPYLYPSNYGTICECDVTGREIRLRSAVDGYMRSEECIQLEIELQKLLKEVGNYEL